ncbi:hypothetical protein K435DRAFT_371464 [Dendrothele bispora CBS 962.96]|uniref:SH3 domain-containing protein n=1 Tax=Dendrothele bispora (strain CBS 962.96) TaxID=1314807 RepID=A0A4S8LBD1_DENBC|nr:hypothetical protein K435DRAFT_371464 [Dendrothele bispora CBS 962.96]
MLALHLLLVIISAVANIAWLVALITQALVTVKYGHDFVRTLWFSIFLQLYVNFRAARTAVLLGRSRKRKRNSFDSASEETLPYRREITVFGGICVVLGVIGVDISIFSKVPLRVTLAVAWLIMVMTNLIWIWLLTAEIGVLHLRRVSNRDLEKNMSTVSLHNSQEEKSTPNPTESFSPPDVEEVDGPLDVYSERHNSPAVVGPRENASSPRSSKRISRTLSPRDSRRVDEEEPLHPEREAASPTITTSDSDRKIYKLPTNSGNSSPRTPSTVMPQNPTSAPKPSNTVFTPFSPYPYTSGLRPGLPDPKLLIENSPLQKEQKPKQAPSMTVTSSDVALSSIVEYNHRAKALFPYTASPESLTDDPDYAELSFRKSEILEVSYEPQRKWWRAKKRNGQVGIVPSNYLQIIQD